MQRDSLNRNVASNACSTGHWPLAFAASHFRRGKLTTGYWSLTRRCLLSAAGCPLIALGGAGATNDRPAGRALYIRNPPVRGNEITATHGVIKPGISGRLLLVGIETPQTERLRTPGKYTAKNPALKRGGPGAPPKGTRAFKAGGQWAL